MVPGWSMGIGCDVAFRIGRDEIAWRPFMADCWKTPSPWAASRFPTAEISVQ